MPRGEFEGRTAAEAAIKACDAFNVSRSQLKFEVLSDEGEGLERKVCIVAEVDEAVAAQKAAQADNSSEDSLLRETRKGGDNNRRERRDSRGGRRDSRGNRRGRRDGRRDNRRDNRRGGRSRGRGPAAEQSDGIEALLDLETVPAESGSKREVVDGDASEKAQKGREVLGELIKLSGLEIEAFLVQDGEEEIHFDLRGEDEARIIGHKGDVLLALQFILNRIVSRQLDGEQVLVLDAASYRGRRRAALANLAKKLAQRAVEEGKAVRLSPMSAHDRRVFHITLKEMEEVETRSEGDGLFRNLLIIPAQFT